MSLFIVCDHVMANPSLAAEAETEDGDIVCEVCFGRVLDEDFSSVHTVCEEARNLLLNGIAPSFSKPTQ